MILMCAALVNQDQTARWPKEFEGVSCGWYSNDARCSASAVRNKQCGGAMHCLISEVKHMTPDCLAAQAMSAMREVDALGSE